MMDRQINNYLDLSPRQPGSSSPITFERAPTPGLSSFTPKPFPTPTTYNQYSSPKKNYQAHSPQALKQRPQQQQQEPAEQQHAHHDEKQQQKEQQDSHHSQGTSDNQNLSTVIDLNKRGGQRKRRQDDDQSFHEDDQDDSTLSSPPSEPEAPIEPQPKRVKVKKITIKSKQLGKPVCPKPDELTDPEYNPNSELQPAESENQAPVRSASMETKRLPKISFKRKKAPQKRDKLNPPSSKTKTLSSTKLASSYRPSTAPASDVPEVQEEVDVVQNKEPSPSNSSRQSPSHHSSHQQAEPTSSNSELKQQQQPSNRSEPPPEQSTPNSSKPTTTKATSNTTATNLKKPSNASQNAPQTSTKKPVKPSFKKIHNKGAAATGFPGSSNPSATATSKLASSTSGNLPMKKAGEYDLNDPSTWGALFGRGDKKPAVKPVKPGNLPPQASLYNGAAVDRLEARKKRRAEEKRILSQQMKVGFDLLRQHSDMMDFEIEYKNHVRAMVERPLSPEYLPMETNEEGNGSGPGKLDTGPTVGIPSGSQGMNGSAPTNVFCRPDGYKRYLNPPPSSSLPPSQTIPPALSHQPPGPLYSSSFSPHLPKKTLPRPGMFGSSFFIWQPPHLP